MKQLFQSVSAGSSNKSWYLYYAGGNIGLSGWTTNSVVPSSREEELMEKMMDSGLLSRLAEGRIGRLTEQLGRCK